MLEIITLDNKNISKIRKIIYADENNIFLMVNIRYKEFPLHILIKLQGEFKFDRYIGIFFYLTGKSLKPNLSLKKD